MTRDFNNQRREDPEVDSRGSSSRRFEDERPSRPARPRLNRDTVDRAWKNGARQNHADYRTRSDSNTQSTRGNGRPDQRSNRYPSQSSSNERKPYRNRRENFQPGERSPRGNTGTRSRTYESGKRPFDDRYNNQFEHRSHPQQTYRGDHRQEETPSPRHPHPRSQYHEQDQYRGPKQRKFDRDTSSPGRYDRSPRQAPAYDRDTRKQRYNARENRPSYNESRSYTDNPRWKSRPERRENSYQNKSREYARHETGQELFEGDYEHFDRSNSVQAQNPQTHTSKRRTEQGNITRLPDGRVLKGSTEAQQRGAEFWTEIAQESDELVKGADTSHIQETAAKHALNPQSTAETNRMTRASSRKASEPAQRKKSTKFKAKQSSPKPRSSGPKPSQRGFKWPAPEE